MTLQSFNVTPTGLPAAPINVSPPRRKRLPVAPVAGLALAGAVLLDALAVTLAAEDVYARLALLVAGMTLAGVWGLVLARASLDRSRIAGPFRLGPTWIVFFTISFGTTALAWLNRNHNLRVGGLSQSPVVLPSIIAQAVLVSTLAMVCWILGYLLKSPALLRRPMARIVRWCTPAGQWSLRTPSMPLLIYFIGTAARLILLRADRFGYLGNASLELNSPSATGQLLGLLSDFALYGLILSAIDAFALTRSLRSRVVFGVLLAIELTVGLFGGTKLQVLLPLVAVAVVAGVRARRTSWKAVVLFILGAMFVFPFVRQYRDFLRPTPTERASTQAAIVEFPKVLLKTFGSFTNGDVFSTVPSDIASRLRQGDNIAVIMEKTPSLIPYRPWTQELYGPIVGLVPRAIWRSKPVLSTGIDFSREYYQVPQVVLSAQAVTWPGDLYRHGGLLPVGVGMLCLGLLGRLVDESVYPTADLRRTVMYLGLFFVLLGTENDIVSLLVGFVQAVFATAVVTKLAFVQR